MTKCSPTQNDANQQFNIHLTEKKKWNQKNKQSYLSHQNVQLSVSSPVQLFLVIVNLFPFCITCLNCTLFHVTGCQRRFVSCQCMQHCASCMLSQYNFTIDISLHTFHLPWKFTSFYSDTEIRNRAPEKGIQTVEIRMFHDAS